MNPEALTLELVRTEMRAVLRSLVREELRLQEVVAVTEDEDEETDAVNDLAHVRVLLARIRPLAVAKYGPSIAEFDFDRR